MAMPFVANPVKAGVNGVARKRPSLANVSSKVRSDPPRIVIHGVSGIGKTSLAAYMPSPLWIQSPGETGLETLVSNNQLPERPIFQFEDAAKPDLMSTQCQSWTDLLGACDALLNDEHTHKTLVGDVFNGWERLCHEYVCGQEFGGDWGEKGFMAYQRGYDIAVQYWKELQMKIDRLRTERGMYFVGLSHSKVTTFKNPVGPDYDRWEPSMHKKTWEATFGWADIVLFLNQETHAVDAKAGAKKAKTVTGVRMMYTTATASWDAKHRHGIPEEIPMGSSGKEAFANLCAEMKKAKEKPQPA